MIENEVWTFLSAFCNHKLWFDAFCNITLYWIFYWSLTISKLQTLKATKKSIHRTKGGTLSKKNAHALLEKEVWIYVSAFCNHRLWFDASSHLSQSNYLQLLLNKTFLAHVICPLMSYNIVNLDTYSSPSVYWTRTSLQKPIYISSVVFLKPLASWHSVETLLFTAILLSLREGRCP